MTTETKKRWQITVDRLDRRVHLWTEDTTLVDDHEIGAWRDMLGNGASYPIDNTYELNTLEVLMDRKLEPGDRFIIEVKTI
jgi:hypothetical protein